jgi:hypothetical protein
VGGLNTKPATRDLDSVSHDCLLFWLEPDLLLFSGLETDEDRHSVVCDDASRSTVDDRFGRDYRLIYLWVLPAALAVRLPSLLSESFIFGQSQSAQSRSAKPESR